jgi:hypothetical protein
MHEELNVLVAKAKQLESEMLAEIREGRQKFGYKMEGRVVRFDAAVGAEHRKMAKSLARYLLEAKWLNIITAPMIWFCVLPILFMDVVAEAYQFVCFPIYGIPKVRRRDYVVMDRGRLLYLNSMERFNCVYCGYVNGVLAYVQEIAGRTEQHWCPIKHAVSLKTRHSRYQHFLDYGDAEQYCKRLEEVRRDFADLKKASMSAALPLNSRINES